MKNLQNECPGVMDYRSGGTKLSCSLQKSSILHVWIESTWEPIKLTIFKILFWFPFHRSEITVMLRVLFCPFFVWEEKVGAGLQKSHSRLKCVRACAHVSACVWGRSLHRSGRDPEELRINAEGGSSVPHFPQRYRFSFSFNRAPTHRPSKAKTHYLRLSGEGGV